MYWTLVPSTNIEFFYYKTSKSHFRLVVLSFSNLQDNILVLFKELEKIFLAISFKLPIKRKSYTQKPDNKGYYTARLWGGKFDNVETFFLTFQGTMYLLMWHGTKPFKIEMWGSLSFAT